MMTALFIQTWGWTEMLWATLISICLVMVVLVLMVYVMKLFGVIFVPHAASSASGDKHVVHGQLHEEEIAAIVTALQLYRSDLHDRESDVITIQSIKRVYSPWNSKIHGLTQMPERRK